jgi:hypothetical protein
MIDVATPLCVLESNPRNPEISQQLRSWEGDGESFTYECERQTQRETETERERELFHRLLSSPWVRRSESAFR